MGLFGNRTIKKMGKAYEVKMKQAMEAQRRGDIQGYAALNEEAEALHRKVKELKEIRS